MLTRQLSRRIIRDSKRSVAGPRSGGTGIPRQGLLAWCANRFDPEQLAFIDRIGGSVRPLHDLQYIQADGTGYFVNAALVTAGITVTSVTGSGTTTYSSPSAGRINMTAGTAWDFTVTWSDAAVSEYAYCSLVTDTYAQCFDRSGNGRHLVATGFAAIGTACASGKEFGSDVLNTEGYSDGGLGPELITNEADRTFSSDTGFWSKGSGWSISGGVANFDGLSSSYLTSTTTDINTSYLYRLEFTSTGNIVSLLPAYYDVGSGDYTIGSMSVIVSFIYVNNFRFYCNSGNGINSLDDISLKFYIPSTVPIPASTTPGIDALGNSLTYPGRAKYNLLPKSAPCVAFDGSGVIVTSVSSKTSFDYKVQCVAPLSGTAEKTIISGNATGCPLIRITVGNLIQVVSNSVSVLGAFSVVLTTGEVYKIRVTGNESVANLYLNDEFLESIVYSTSFSTNGIMVIGAQAVGALYSKKFTDNIWDVEIDGITFPLSEGSGTTVFGYDTSGNNYTGTCTGFLGAIWSTQSEYFHGLTYGDSADGVPANPYTPGLDCLGNALTNPPLKWNDSAYYTMPNADQIRDALGWTYGTDNYWYDSDGIAKELTLDNLYALGAGFNFYMGAGGLAVYDTPQIAKDASIERSLRIPAESYGDAFVMTFNIASDSETLTIQCQNVDTFNAVIDWGDGSTSTITAYNDADLAHVYSKAGQYDVRISGTFPNIYFNNSGDKLKLITIKNFGNTGFTRFNNAFYGCANLVSVTSKVTNTSLVTSMYSMFYGCSGLTALDVSGFNTSLVTNMYAMFYSCSGLTALDVSGFNTSLVTDMTFMFSGCSSLTSLDISGLNTSLVTNMAYMFNSCSNLISLDVSGFDTSLATSMGSMFRSCSSLTSLDVSGFNIEAINNVANLTNFATNVTIPTVNYDATLINWAAQNVLSGLTPNFGTNTKYTPGGAAEAARNYLINTKGWTITDGGPVA